MYSRILVAVDGTPPSELALLEAIKIAKSSDARLRLVHIVDEFIMDGYLGGEAYYASVIDALRDGGRKILDDAVAIARKHDVPAEPMLLDTVGHRVAEHIVAQSRAWPADLIVMGTHGRRGLRRVLLGSDAELVLRTAAVPILLVRGTGEAA